VCLWYWLLFGADVLRSFRCFEVRETFFWCVKVTDSHIVCVILWVTVSFMCCIVVALNIPGVYRGSFLYWFLSFGTSCQVGFNDVSCAWLSTGRRLKYTRRYE
jgi:hypothetical protein